MPTPTALSACPGPARTRSDDLLEIRTREPQMPPHERARHRPLTGLAPQPRHPHRKQPRRLHSREQQPPTIVAVHTLRRARLKTRRPIRADILRDTPPRRRPQPHDTPVPTPPPATGNDPTCLHPNPHHNPPPDKSQAVTSSHRRHERDHPTTNPRPTDYESSRVGDNWCYSVRSCPRSGWSQAVTADFSYSMVTGGSGPSVHIRCTSTRCPGVHRRARSPYCSAASRGVLSDCPPAARYRRRPVDRPFSIARNPVPAGRWP